METLPFQTVVFESDIEGFKSDNDYDLTHKYRLRSQIYVRIVIIEDEEAEGPDICNSRAPGKPNKYSFDGCQWTKHLIQLKFKNNDIQ